MKILTLKETNVIIAIGEDVVEVENGIKIDNTIYPMVSELNVIDVEIPEGVEISKYCYTEVKGFYANPTYVEYKSVEQRLSELEAVVFAK